MIRTRREIVVVDDDPLILSSVETVLSPKYTVRTFSHPDTAEIYLKAHDVDLVLLDLNIGPIDGLDVFRSWQKLFPELDVIFCSGETRVKRAVQCMRQGAAEYLVKPVHPDDLILIVERTLEKSLLRRNASATKPIASTQQPAIIGSSPEIQNILEKVAKLKNQPHLSILILGESGTGKELVARLLHQQENDSKRPYVIVNMPAIPNTLVESELFGTTKGAYTDSKCDRAGKFELADGGDIFLDEIGDLGIETQAKILRVLQEKQVERLGSGRTRRVEFRIISATNQPLNELIASGRFREDLLYRLSDVVLQLPTLAARKYDIPELARHFIAKHSRKTPHPELSDKVLNQLQDYHWPGNVRQLESTIKRALVFCEADEIKDIEIFDLQSGPYADAPSTSNIAENTYVSEVGNYERRLIQKTVVKHAGNRADAMKELNMSRATFYRKLKTLQIQLP